MGTALNVRYRILILLLCFQRFTTTAFQGQGIKEIRGRSLNQRCQVLMIHREPTEAPFIHSTRKSFWQSILIPIPKIQ